MEGETKIKDFRCLIHNTKVVKKVLRDSTSSRLLYCEDCIKDLSMEGRNQLENLDKFLKEIIETIGKLQSDRYTADPLIEVLLRQDKLIELVSNHINKNKESFIKGLDQIENSIKKILKDTKIKVSAAFDTQNKLFRFNFEKFQEELIKLKIINEKPSPSTFQGIAKEINQIDTTNELAMKVRELLFKIDEFRDDWTKKRANEEEKGIRFQVNQMKVKLLEPLEKLPELNLCRDLKKFEDEIIRNIEKSINEAIVIINPIPSILSITNNSKLLKNSFELTLQEFLSFQDMNFSLKLVMRANKDGSNLEEIGNYIQNSERFLILIKTHKYTTIGCLKDNQNLKKGVESISFDYSNDQKREDKKHPSVSKGYHGISTSIYLTSNKVNDNNLYHFQLMKMHNLNIRAEDYVCICINYIENGNTVSKLSPKKDYWEKVIFGVTDIEIFDVSISKKEDDS